MRWTVVRKISSAGCLCLLVLLALPREASGQQKVVGGTCDDLTNMAGNFWQGTRRTMTLRELASYAAPVYWLSPDEPTMGRKARKDLRVPAALPFGLWEIGVTLGYVGVWASCYLAFANAFPRVRAVLMTSPYRDEVQVPVNPETMEPLPAHE